MKIASWNIEWMNHWFTSDSGPAQWRSAAQIRGVSDIEHLAQRVAAVIQSMAADVLLIQEGPSRKAELALFVDDYLSGDYDIVGPSGSGQQKLYALIRKGGAVVKFERAYSSGEIDLDAPWMVDIDGTILDGRLQLEEYQFTRAPLMVDIFDGKHTIRVINLHLKSKYIHKGQRMWSNSATRPAFIVEAVKVRRRISAEAMRIREYLNELMEQDDEMRVVVCGDFNDGPGTDFFERQYLTHNLVATIAGNPCAPRRMFRHGFADRVDKQENFTAIFDDFIDEVDGRKVLLDHILVSPGLYWKLRDGTIDHQAFALGVDNTLPGSREKLPSDHRPQWISFA